MSLSPNFSVCGSATSPPGGCSSFKSDLSPKAHGILLEGLESTTKEVEYRKRHDTCESSFTSRQQTYACDEASSYVENQVSENCFEIPLSSTQHLTPSNDLPDLATISDFDSELMHSDDTGNFLAPNSLVGSSIQHFTDNVENHRHSHIEESSFTTVSSELYGSDNDFSRSALGDPVNVTQLVGHFETPAYSGLSLDRTNTCNSSAASAYPRGDIFSNLENVADVSQYPFETWSHSGFQPVHSKPTDQRHFDKYKGLLAHYDYPAHFSPPISNPANQKYSYNHSLCSDQTATTIWNSSAQNESSHLDTSNKVNTEEKCEPVSIIDLTTSPSPSGNESAMSEDSSSFQSTSCIHSYTSFVDHGWCSEPASHEATDVLASQLGEREIQMRSGEECVADGSMQRLRSGNDRFITSCNELVGSNKAHDPFSLTQAQGCPENEWSKWHFSPATTLPDGHRADHVAQNDYLESSSFHSGESARFDAASQASDQLLPTSSETGPSRSSFTHKGNAPVIELANRDLWWKFFEIGTEMIITKAGRRMFPAIKLKVNFLNPLKTYVMAVDIMPIDNNRYRYVYHSSQWMAAGTTEASVAPCTYFHPDSPARGEVWMRQDVTFDKLKLTNHELNKKGHVVLHSMHKYQPRIHLIECDDHRPIEIEHLVPRNMRIDDVVREDVTTFVFPECAFTTVTAYQNQQITKLKIDRNPFAKGFRDSSKLWRPKQNVAAGKSKRAWSSSGNSETGVPCHVSQTAAERSPRNPVTHHYSRCEANAQDYHKICHSTQFEANPSSTNHLHVRNLEQASNIYCQHSSVDAVDSFQYLGGIPTTETMKPEMMHSDDVRSFESTSDTGSVPSSFSCLVPFYQP